MNKKRYGKFFIRTALLLALFSIAATGIIYYLNYFPPQQELAQIVCIEKNTLIKPGSRLKILVWNIQYAAGINHHFFYEGGKDVYVERENIIKTLEKMSKVIEEVNPDIIILQEVDLPSTRSAYTNEMHLLLQRFPHTCGAYATDWRSKYIPVPWINPVKSIHSGLATLSRYSIKNAIRYSLPPMQRLTRIIAAFYPKRAVLETSFMMANGKKLTVFNTHLDAFSKGDNTLFLQVNSLLSKINSNSNEPFIVAGDFNLLPPGENPERLAFWQEEYPADAINPARLLFKKLKPALTVLGYRKNPKHYNTYIPPLIDEADRWIDYVFVSENIKVISYRVLQLHPPLSDHHPILVELELPR